MNKIKNELSIQRLLFLLGILILTYKGVLKNTSLISIMITMIFIRPTSCKEGVKSKGIIEALRIKDINSWLNYILLFVIIVILSYRGTI